MAAAEAKAFKAVQVQSVFDGRPVQHKTMETFVRQNGYLKEVPPRSWTFQWRGPFQWRGVTWLLTPQSGTEMRVKCQGLAGKETYQGLRDVFNELYSLLFPKNDVSPCALNGDGLSLTLDFEDGLKIDDDMAPDTEGDEGAYACMNASVVIDHVFRIRSRSL